MADGSMTMVPATVANMRRVEPRAVMIDSAGNTFSATPGDYFMFPEDEVLEDEYGVAMHLVVPTHSYRHAHLVTP